VEISSVGDRVDPVFLFIQVPWTIWNHQESRSWVVSERARHFWKCLARSPRWEEEQLPGKTPRVILPTA